MQALIRNDLRVAIVFEQLYDRYCHDGRALTLQNLKYQTPWTGMDENYPIFATQALA